MQSTKIITESLAHWNKVPDAPSMTEFHVEDISKGEDRESGSEAFAQHSEERGTFVRQAEVTEVPGSPTSEQKM